MGDGTPRRLQVPNPFNLDWVSEPGRDEESNHEDDRLAMNAGVGAALGAGVGAALFAVTGEVLWIAVGPAFGVAVGVALGPSRDSD